MSLCSVQCELLSFFNTPAISTISAIQMRRLNGSFVMEQLLLEMKPQLLATANAINQNGEKCMFNIRLQNFVVDLL